MIPENARDIAALDEQIALSRHALAALAGKLPDAADAIAPKFSAIAAASGTAAPALPAALPAELLGHRADVVAARWRVEAALRGMDSTKAMFYPNVELSLFTGFSSIGLDQWLNAGSRRPGIGIAVNLPIFDADRLRSLYRVSAANVDAAVASYNGALLEALHEVADRLSTLRALDAQIAHQQATEASARRAYELSLERYRADISDRLNVLNLETALIAQRRASIELAARRIDTRVRLIAALGGGFSEYTGAPAEAGDARRLPDPDGASK